MTSTPNSTSTGVLLATALVYVSAPNGQKVLARALLDNCSEASFISESLLQRLRLGTKPVFKKISGVGGVRSITCQKEAEFLIHPHFSSSFSCKVNALVLQTVTRYQPPKVQINSSLSHVKNITLADPRYMDLAPIDLLLDIVVNSSIVEAGVLRGGPGEPVATNSSLGWLLSVRVLTEEGDFDCDRIELHLVSFHVSEEVQLIDLVQRFWLQEKSPSVNSFSPEERMCDEHYEKSHSRDADGRYVVRLPFKDLELPQRALGDSYGTAVQMLRRMETRFKSNPDFRRLYMEFMQDYIDQGHATLLPESTLDRYDSGRYFLPHHGVLKPSSSTTKLRTVFNGSSKTTNGVSLNDLLCTGPNLLPELPDLICSWRRYKIAFVADIKQMFRQIVVDARDRRFQTIVWRFSPGDCVGVYELNAVTYGLKPSPFLASRTVKQASRDYESEFPLGSVVAAQEFYMDDVLSGASSVCEALEKQTQLMSLLENAGLELRKWLSNATEITSHLPPDHVAVEPEAFLNPLSAVAVLGVNWKSNDAVFVFKIKSCFDGKDVTMRSVLSEIARIFDPMGWLAPVIITAKIFMQSLWLLKIGWDQPLPLAYANNWRDWSSKIEILNSIAVPRYIHWDPTVQLCEVHGFADASKLALAAVIYLRIALDGQVFVSLQLAKTRVAPLQTISIPKLELNAAHLLAQLGSRFHSIMPFSFQAVHLWSDSKDVLYWLRDHPSRWPTFIANRCSHIQTLMPGACWHHVASKDNPADVASRGVSPGLLKDHSLWWKGPSMLSESCSPWSTAVEDLSSHKPSDVSCSKRLKRTKSEETRLFVNTTVRDKDIVIWDLVRRYSSFSRLVRITAYILRFLLVIRRRTLTRAAVGVRIALFDLPFIKVPESFEVDLPVDELENSRLVWVFIHQRAFFDEEISLLKRFENGELVNKKLVFKGALLKLQPVLVDGLLRVGGRLNNAQLDYDRRHPLILPGGCVLSQLIIRQVHFRTLHGGTQLTLGTLRRDYWILGGRCAVRRVIQCCEPCVRQYAHTRTQLMGDLPSTRVLPSHPFSFSGVDYAGPVRVRMTRSRGRGTKKAYICIFVCFSTRAVHLEPVEDCESESFIAAFHRFSARRGQCVEIRSDCGRNFVGADAELRDMFSEASTHMKSIVCSLAQDGTTWKFNPPGAPHFGGIWESAVKSMKHHLYRIIGDHILTYSELHTLLCKIEACLNSRPLIPLSDDPTDLSVLTPAHFLILRDSYIVPEPDLTDESLPIGRRWKIVSKMVQDFWNRWMQEYLSSLLPRPKWNERTQSLQVGDLVFIRLERTPPSKWPMARVVEIHPGKDDLVRVCTVRTSTTELRRPISKLVLLPKEDNAQLIPLPPLS